MMQIPEIRYEHEDSLFLLYHLPERYDAFQVPKLVSNVNEKTLHLILFSLSFRRVVQLPDVVIRFSVLNLREPGSVLRTQGFL